VGGRKEREEERRGREEGRKVKRSDL
jgi:hypothetical protein